MDTRTAVPAYPPSRTHPLDPSPVFARLREDEPITRMRLDFDGNEVWVVTRYEDICAVLGDPRFSSDFSRPGFPARMTVKPPGPGTFIRLDPPDHTRLRRALVNEFKARRVEEMRPKVQGVMDGIVDGILAAPRPVDLVPALALPLPILVICELFGVPYDDRDFFQRCTGVIGDQNAPPERRQVVRAELWDYMAELMAHKAETGADDLLGRLAGRRERNKLGWDEVVGIATLLVIAGYETIANQLGIGTLALLQNPDQVARLSDPETLRTAVDEALRYQTIIGYGLRRAATEDVEIAGTTIRAGEGVIAVLASGNRDQQRFPDPDHFDAGRDAADHLAFGYGVHQCLGQLLARLELQVAWGTLFRRIPDLRLAVPLEEVPFRDDMFVYGVQALPVTW